MTILIMLLLALGIMASVLVGAKRDDGKDSFMSIDDAMFLRGFWCLIVVMVHVPKAYQNRIQDMLGSFAFVGVTFFFMTSAYGLKVSLARKPGYMARFWRRRLPAILVPALIANALSVLVKALTGGAVTPLSLINVNDWVKVLLGHYVLFWVIYGLLPRWLGQGRWQDVSMCLAVAALSLVERLTPLSVNLGWVVEPLGFAYGIIAANYADAIRCWTHERWLGKAAALGALSAALGVAYLKYKPVPVLGDYLLKIALGMAITAFVFQLIARIRVGNRVNRFLGGISYEVYLLHRPAFALVAAIAAGGMKLGSGAFIALALAITIVLAFGLKKLCDAMLARRK